MSGVIAVTVGFGFIGVAVLLVALLVLCPLDDHDYVDELTGEILACGCGCGEFQ